MSILLPTRPGVRTASPQLLDFGVLVTPPQGGPAQRVNRLGNRWAMDVVAPTSHAEIGQVLVARLAAGLTEGVLLPVPQDIGSAGAGAPVVDGAAQQGSTLALRGITPGYNLREGQWLSIIYAGRRYLHMIGQVPNGAIAADAEGKSAFSVIPMLRISPNDAAVVELDQPMIEGFMTGNVKWQLQTAPYIDVTFTVTEAE